MEVQEGSGLSCTVQSLHSEMSHLIGRHSAVQLWTPPLYMSPRIFLATFWAKQNPNLFFSVAV